MFLLLIGCKAYILWSSRKECSKPHSDASVCSKNAKPCESPVLLWLDSQCSEQSAEDGEGWYTLHTWPNNSNPDVIIAWHFKKFNHSDYFCWSLEGILEIFIWTCSPWMWMPHAVGISLVATANSCLVRGRVDDGICCRKFIATQLRIKPDHRYTSQGGLFTGHQVKHTVVPL